MQKEIFMTSQDFVNINTMLLKNCDMVMYGAKDRHELIAEIDLKTFDPSANHYLLLIGLRSDGQKLTRQIAIDNVRADKIGFVDVQFGGEDVHAVGATLYLADTSETAKIVNRELTKILKKHAHKGIIGEESNNVFESAYWTDAVWNAGKSKYVYFIKSKPFSWRPKEE